MGHITDVLHFYICKHVLEIILAKNKNLMKDETYFGTLNKFLFRKNSMEMKVFYSSNYYSHAQDRFGGAPWFWVRCGKYSSSFGKS